MYRLTQFGTVNIRYYNQVDFVGSGQTDTSYQALPEGGALDNFGSQQKNPSVVERTKTMRLSEVDETTLKQTYFTLLALRGTRDRLYRESPDGKIEWCWARLVEVSASRSFEDARYTKNPFQNIELRFVQQSAFWFGDEVGQFFDSGLLFDNGETFDTGNVTNLDTSPEVFNVVVGTDAGRAPIRDITICVYADSSPITALTIARTGGESLTFNATIAANESLIINTGTMQVFNGGADAYDDLVISPTADLANWFTLETGTNEITVTFTGGGTNAQIEFVYREAWY